ncbi:MAG: serpin family protein [Myxococcales bacterium]
MRSTSRLVKLALLPMVVLACRGPEADPAPGAEAPGELAASDKSRLAVQAPQADLAAAVKGHNAFAFELYRRLTRDGENLFFSPTSIVTALSMTYAGAAGDTEKAFATVLGSALAQPAHHRAMNDLDAQLNGRGQNARAADGQPFRLRSTNQLFAQKGYPFETPFLDTLATEYGANVRLLDFVAETEPSRLAINDWVAQKTEDRIKNLLSPGIITADTRLVLVNAIYFNASWRQPFEPAATREGDFHKADGSTTRAHFMRDSALRTRAAQVNGVEVFELPYDGNELSMLVLVPPAGGLAALEASLDAAQLDAYVQALQSETLELSFPRFETRTTASLSKPLQDMGLAVAFGSGADFTAMSRNGGLAITDVAHQAFVKVNEKGTEAAAATAVVVGETSLPVARPLVVDRPFVFAIRDHATGALVFVGRIVAP